MQFDPLEVLTALILIFSGCLFGLWIFDSLIGDRFVWFCDKMGWHKAPKTLGGFDGCSLHGRCPRCHKRVLQDSQGNWFTASIQED